MDTTNITDPSGVLALLDKLRSSPAWQEAVSKRDQPQPDPVAPVQNPSTSASVASLLSQLHQPSSSIPNPPAGTSSHLPPVRPRPPHITDSNDATKYPTYDYDEPHFADAHPEPLVAQPAPRLTSDDPKAFTFQQALPALATLSEDDGFVTCLRSIKTEQDELEKRLWDEREAIQTKYEEKVKVAQTKASMIGVGLSKHEATMLSDAYAQELRKFDLQRALPAWDGLVAQQQARLESLKVPCMSVTDAKPDREKQQKVIQVLEGVVG